MNYDSIPIYRISYCIFQEIMHFLTFIYNHVILETKLAVYKCQVGFSSSETETLVMCFLVFSFIALKHPEQPHPILYLSISCTLILRFGT